MLGRELAKGLVAREELFLLSKLPQNALQPDRVERFLTKSLDRLGLKYLDMSTGAKTRQWHRQSFSRQRTG